MFRFHLGSYRSSGKKKKTKVPKDNWFERIKVDELKQICRAAKLPVTGAKKIIIGRLFDNETTEKYSAEGRWGYTVDTLKEECSKRNLVQSGNKFTIVLRLVQFDNGTAPEAIAAATKRPAPTNPDGTAKKSKPSRPKLDKIYERVQKKVLSCDQKKYQSHWGSKTHSPELYSMIEKLIDKECIEKGYVKSDPLFALEIAKSALVSLNDNFSSINRPGYDDDYLTGAFSSLETILEAAKPLMSKELIGTTITWMEELDAELDSYGLGEGDGKERSLVTAVKILKDDDEKDKDEEHIESTVKHGDDDKKMPANECERKESNGLENSIEQIESAIKHDDDDKKMPANECERKESNGLENSIEQIESAIKHDEDDKKMPAKECERKDSNGLENTMDNNQGATEKGEA